MRHGEASCWKLSPPVIPDVSWRVYLTVVSGGGLRFPVVAEIWPSSIRVMTAAMVNWKVKRMGWCCVQVSWRNPPSVLHSKLGVHINWLTFVNFWKIASHQIIPRPRRNQWIPLKSRAINLWVLPRCTIQKWKCEVEWTIIRTYKFDYLPNS